MAFSPTDSRSLTRLLRAVELHRTTLAPYRKRRVRNLERILGEESNDTAAAVNTTPLPLFALATSILMRYLVSRSPRTFVTTPIKQYRPGANVFKQVLNEDIDRMNLASSLRRLIVDAFVGCGVSKMGRQAVSVPNGDNAQPQAGDVFVESVDLDDFVIDMSARHWDEATVIGNYYQLPLDLVRGNPLYRDTDKLVAMSYSGKTEDGEPRAQTVTSGQRGSEEEFFQDYVRLLDLYLPQFGLLLTVPAIDDCAVPTVVRSVQWSGPPKGPYRKLGLGIEVPTSPMPMSALGPLASLHDAANHIWNKVIKRGCNAKEILAVMAGGDEDVARINNASDMEAVRVDSPQAVGKQSFNAADQQSIALGIMLKDLFNMFAGNLNMLGGLAPQSNTLGQDKLLAQTSSRLVQDMADETVSFTREIVRDLAYYRWNSDEPRLTVIKVAGQEFTKDFHQDGRRGRYTDYMFDVEPYSLQHRSPQERLQQLASIMQTFVLPGMPLLQQQGTTINYSEFLKLVTQYADMPEFDSVLMYQEPVQAQPALEQSAKPSETTRNYVRQNVPGAATQQKDEAMAMALMGNTQQPSEMATMMR